jgi:gluconate kinase
MIPRPMVRYRPAMGMRNYLIEGVSGTGKTSVCQELRRRGFQAINGDTELAYQGDPETGEPTGGEPSHWHHVWNVDEVRSLVADQNERVTFFCGGSRNFSKFQDLFDGVFVLEIDLDTLIRRLDQRPEDEFGAQQSERDLIVRLHRTKEDTPRNGILIDATAPLAHVVDEIVREAGAIDRNRADLALSARLRPTSAPQHNAVAAQHRLRTARVVRVVRVVRVDEDSCQVWSHGEVSTVGFAPMFPSPRVERVSPGHLVAVATGPKGIDVVVWRWFDAVVLGTEDDGSVRLWEPAHGEVVALARGSYVQQDPGRSGRGPAIYSGGALPCRCATFHAPSSRR